MSWMSFKPVSTEIWNPRVNRISSRGVDATVALASVGVATTVTDSVDWPTMAV